MTKRYSNHLQNMTGELFGRKAELQLLDKAWASKDTRVIQFIAPGGTGKTKLLQHWISQTKSIDTLIAWSFNTQGSGENQQVSTTPFFNHAFELLGATRTTFSTEESKGEHLAELLQQSRSVLVLDGLELVQHAGADMRGELKDRAIRQLLKRLCENNAGLCIITTQIALPKYYDNPHATSKALKNLTLEDGVKVLQSLGVDGKKTELKNAVKAYDGHALTLHLLGNALQHYFDGDVNKQDAITDLIGEDKVTHATNVMQAYSQLLDDTPERKLLQLLGLFNHPIDTTVLKALWKAKIPGLTAGVSTIGWKTIISNLREKHHLLTVNEENPDLLDCHPMIRQFFAQQLCESQPDTWQQAHALLYEYYKALPEKDRPDTLEEMQPLFSAVAHGCAAGLHQQALREVYIPRIRRNNLGYLVREFNAISDDLATLAHFFAEPWHTLASGLSQADHAYVLATASIDLSLSGRLREALGPLQASINMYVDQKSLKNAAISISNLSKLQFTLGEVDAALNNSQCGIDYAEQSEDPITLIMTHATRADILHQTGETTPALQLFKETEDFQKENYSAYPTLYSLQGYYYCDLILTLGDASDAIKRTRKTLKWARDNGGSALSIVLDQLTFARTYLQQKSFSEAIHWLDHAVLGLRDAGSLDYLACGLLYRAAFYYSTSNPDHDFACAREDLQEVYEIIQFSGIQLYLTDYHLGMARLLLAEKASSKKSSAKKSTSQGLSIKEHLAEAAQMIDKTGYKRRSSELQALQKELS